MITLDNFQQISWNEIKKIDGTYVYILYHIKDNGYYIGVSGSKNRIYQHKLNLYKGTDNKNLQKAFDKYDKKLENIVIYIYYTKNHYNIEAELLTSLNKKLYNIIKPKKPINNLPQKKINAIYNNIQIKDGCWLWIGSIHHSGYGIIRYKGKSWQAHRVLFTLEKRKEYNDPFWEIPNNLLLRHTCNNKNCCNPQHLILGTDKDNINDTIEQYRKQYTIWGETKSLQMWLQDPRANPQLSYSTIIGRLNRGYSLQEAITAPPYFSKYNKKIELLKKRKEREKRKIKQWKIAYVIRKLYENYEHIEDLMKHFELSYSNIMLIIKCKKWYNPKISCKHQFNYIPKKRRVYTKKYKGVTYSNNYFYGYVYIGSKCYSCGKFTTEVEAAQVVNETYIKYGYEPPNKID